MDAVRDRIKEIREYRHISQEEIAGWLGVSKQAWGKKERGEVDGFSPEDFKVILENTQIDARWLFGQLPDGTPIQEADLKIRKEEYSYSKFVAEVRELAEEYKPAEKDPLFSRIRSNTALREIVEQIQYLDAIKLSEIKACIFGFLFTGKQKEEKRDAV